MAEAGGASPEPSSRLRLRLTSRFTRCRFPNESLSLADTLRGFTTGAAYASFQEDRVGSLEKGKEADFIVLGQDLFAVEEFEIPEMKVRATVVGGRLYKGRLQ